MEKVEPSVIASAINFKVIIQESRAPFFPQETYCPTQESYPHSLHTQPTKLTKFK